MIHRPFNVRLATRTAAVILASAGLAACSQGGMTDLQNFVATGLAKKGGEIPEMPIVKPYTVYDYASADKKDPFEPFFEEEPEPEPVADSGFAPDPNRRKEELEQFPLDTLRMVGTLEREDRRWGIVLSTDGNIYRVQVDNFMGQNYGKIVNILEDRIELLEIARDARGVWQERAAALALIE